MSGSELLHDAPPPKRRWPILIGITAFLCSQVWVPASYYWSDKPTAERFAWRMFSSIDLSTWNTKIVVVSEQNGNRTEHEVPVASYLQETHVKSIQRAQLDVVEPLLRQLAQQPGVVEVRFLAQGTFPSGRPMQPIQLLLRDGKIETVSS